MDFDPNRLNIPKRPLPKAENPHRHRKGEKFIKGPIPWYWVIIAARQPGRALHVALALWFTAGIKGTRTVALSRDLLASLGLDRHAAYRGLNALEKCGLVSLVRAPGRHPVVTILDGRDPVGSSFGAE